MTDTGKRIYEFGPFHIDSVERLLYRREEMIPLTPKVIDTLLVLLGNAGRVLEKDELIRAIWPDSFVEEGGLARNISLLRKVFEESAGEEPFIETIPRRGYRFIAPVKTVSAAEPADIPAVVTPKRRPRWEWIVAALLLAGILGFGYYRLRPQPARIGSLVVLPLTNLSDDPALAQGMHEALINALAKIGSLRVISQTSAMTYQGIKKPLPVIANELNVDAVVEGSVQKDGGRVRIRVQLFEAKTEKPLWADSYDKDLRDVLSLESDVATAIAGEIQVKLTPREKQRLASSRPVNPEAWLDYYRGRFYWNKRTSEGFQKGMESFQTAIAKDPAYAAPYAGIADAYAVLGGNGTDAMPPLEAMPKAKEAALKAVELDDTLADGHASLGYVRLAFDWDLNAAQHEFQRSIELNPGYATAHHWYAHYWLAMAKPEQALAEMRRAQLQDPFSLVINMGLGWCLYHARRYDAAIDQYRSTLAMDPGFALAHATLGMAYEKKQMFPEAIEEFRKASALAGSTTLAMAGLGSSYGLSGRRREAEQVLNQLDKTGQKQYVPAIYRAVIYAAIGETDLSLKWARKGYDERSDGMIYLRTEPWADGLRSDPRFQDLLRLVEQGRH